MYLYKVVILIWYILSINDLDASNIYKKVGDTSRNRRSLWRKK